jgi:hypothetical protein
MEGLVVNFRVARDSSTIGGKGYRKFRHPTRISCLASLRAHFTQQSQLCFGNSKGIAVRVGTGPIWFFGSTPTYFCARTSARTPLLA